MLFPVGHTNSAYDLSGYADSSEGRKADFFFRLVLPDRLEKAYHTFLDHIIFISFSLQNLINLRKQLPDQPAQWLTGDWKEEYKSYLVDNNLDLDIWYGSLTEETYAWLRSLGKKVNVWTCDDPAAAAKYVEMGVDYITSNILE